MTALPSGTGCAPSGFAVRTVGSPSLTHTSPVAETSMCRSCSTSLVPFFSTTNPTSDAPLFSFTYANAPYASRPTKPCPSGQVVPSPSAMSPQVYRFQPS